MSIVVVDHVSLDGVVQGPGRPDGDPRDGVGMDVVPRAELVG